MKIRIKPIIRNKYFLASFAFVLLLLLNDRNSVFDQYKYKKELKAVEAKHKFYQDEITRLRKEKEELFGSEKNLEKFAREKYLMKRDDEDVFVMIENETEKEKE
ncbi:MAG: FtsB family cell division protein [Bacteroidia bacterium]